MSLSTLNSPLLISSLGVGALAALPALEQSIFDGTISWTAIQAANVVAYGLNVFATSRPGRIDGNDVQSIKKGDEKDAQFQGKRGRTMLAPSGWAFAIWGPIFLGELVFTAAQLTLKESSPLVPIVKQVSGPFISSQLFQSLWAATFRPKYEGNLRYISAGMLTGIAFSLSKAHEAFSGPSNRNSYSKGQFILFFLPVSLHFGWTTAAALVNWNGALIIQDYTTPRIATWVGHFSVIAATGLGVALTVARSAPVFGGVISWALTALGTGMTKRIEDTKTVTDRDTLGVYGIEVQQRLCFLGALATAATSAAVALAVAPKKW